MSRSMSIAAVAILLFFAFLATFTSAAPTGIERRHRWDDNPTSTNNTSTDNTSTNNTDPNNPTNTTDPNEVNNDTSNPTDDTTSSNTLSGEATWYDTGLGACGDYDTDSDFIVALAENVWDGGSHCNKQIEITNPANGKSCTATVRDLCPGCGNDSLDMSPAVFEFLEGDLGVGIFHVLWYFE